MRTYRCICGNVTFTDNTRCLACGHELGYCPVCRNLSALLPQADGTLKCGNADCGAGLAKCFNYSQHKVCNRCVPLPAEAEALCDCCRFNDTIPDLTVAGNWVKWQRLESAKRRLFYGLNQLGLPYGTEADGIQPPLSFAFMADPIVNKDHWRPVGKREQVFTGHDNGRITINIREADDAERERLRVVMGEAQRTLIGHFRHEIGHYFWISWSKAAAKRSAVPSLATTSIRPTPNRSPRHYKEGPPENWSDRFVSAYATMHPWEDFAETWATYLDMAAALDTAEQMGFGGVSDLFSADFIPMLVRYQQLGIAMNELNRTMGLIDLVPEVFVPRVVEKLNYIHQLVQAGREENGALQAVRTARQSPPPAAQPVAQAPTAQQPVTPQPVAQQPAAQQPVAPQPAAQQPVAPQPQPAGACAA